MSNQPSFSPTSASFKSLERYCFWHCAPPCPSPLLASPTSPSSLPTSQIPPLRHPILPLGFSCMTNSQTLSLGSPASLSLTLIFLKYLSLWYFYWGGSLTLQLLSSLLCPPNLDILVSDTVIIPISRIRIWMILFIPIPLSPFPHFQLCTKSCKVSFWNGSCHLCYYQSNDFTLPLGYCGCLIMHLPSFPTQKNQFF